MRDSANPVAAPSKPVRAERQPCWVITPHAVTRFIERVAPGMSRQRAARSLVLQCQGAHFVKTLPSGLEQWRGPKPRRLRLRVNRDGDVLELVTVLWSFDR